MIDQAMTTELIRRAIEMRDSSYVPYSNYSVGAALLGKNGKIYGGCNIENATYTPTICAERTAIFKAVSEGQKEFTAIAICGGKKGQTSTSFASPCGVCRQVIREFCEDDFTIILVNTPEDYKVYTLGELLPESFGPEKLR